MISIIIPTYNEADQIARTIRHIHNARDNHEVEIIIAEGGSTDETIKLAEENGKLDSKKREKGHIDCNSRINNRSLFYIFLFILDNRW